MNADETLDALVKLAKDEGAVYPAVAELSDGSPIVVDTDSGRTWRVKLEEF